MLFRVLMIAGSVVSFASSCGSVMQILTAAAAAGAVWVRCGSDGKNGTQLHHHADSRVHRCGREVGFRRANQADIDADPRSRQVYAQLRGQVNKVRSQKSPHTSPPPGEEANERKRFSTTTHRRRETQTNQRR